MVRQRGVGRPAIKKTDVVWASGSAKKWHEKLWMKPPEIEVSFKWLFTSRFVGPGKSLG